MKKQIGITLIILIIIIIILLILAGIIFNAIIDDEIIDKTIESKKVTEDAEELEKLSMSISAAKLNNGGKIDEYILEQELNKYFGEEGYNKKGTLESGWNIIINDNEYRIENGNNVKKIERLLNGIERVEPKRPDDWIFDIDEISNTITITGYKGNETEVIFPNSICGIPVKHIAGNEENGTGEAAFRNGNVSVWDDSICSVYWIGGSTNGWNAYTQKTITKVIISEGIESIGGFDFYDSTELKEIVLPSTLKEIKNCAFSLCNSLQVVEIPDSVSLMGETIFLGNIDMIVTIPFKDGESIPCGWKNNWAVVDYSGSIIEINYEGV